MVLFYCENCGVRVDPEDLDSGTAQRMDESRAICSACFSQQRGAVRSSSGETELPVTLIDDATRTPLSTPAVGAPGSSEARKAQRATQGVPALGNKPVSGEFTRRSTQQIPAQRGPSSRAQAAAAGPESGRQGAAGTGPANPNKWMAFGLGACVVLIGALIAVMNTGSAKTTTDAAKPTTAEEPPKAVATPQTPPVQPAPPEPELPKDPREREAALLLREANAFQKANPTDVYGYSDRLEELFNAYRMTGAGAEAQRLLKTLQYPDPQTQLAPDAAWSAAESLLPLIETNKDVVSGRWKKDGAGLVVEPEKGARIQIPYEPPDEYDFRIVFKRLSGEEDVNQMLSARGRALMWSMASSKNTSMGFECIGGKDAANGPVNVRSSKALENNRSYTCIVQVRKRVVRAYVDGKFIKEYKTDYSEFTMRNDWKLKNSRVLGLGAHNSKVVFEKVDVRTVSGTGRRVR